MKQRSSVNVNTYKKGVDNRECFDYTESKYNGRKKCRTEKRLKDE